MHNVLLLIQSVEINRNLVLVARHCQRLSHRLESNTKKLDTSSAENEKKVDFHRTNS